MYKGQYYSRQTKSGRWRIFQVTFASSLSVTSRMVLEEPSYPTEQDARNRIRQLNVEKHHTNK